MVSSAERAVAALSKTLTPSIYGFSVRTDCVLRFLRLGGGAEDLEIVAGPSEPTRPVTPPLADWPLAGAEFEARATLYRTEFGYEFWATDAGRYVIDLKHGRIEIPGVADEIVREQRLWGLPMMLSYIDRGDFPLHSATVELGSGAVLLAGPSKYGKTTLALACHSRGYRILNEDLVCCRSGRPCEVLPGPALVRMRPDVYGGSPPAGTHVVIERPDRIYLGLDADRKGGSNPIPIRAVVFLREADTVRMERVHAPTAVADLWHLNFHFATKEFRGRSFQQLTGLVGSVPCWNLFRPFDLARLEETVGLLVKQLDR